MSGLTLVIFGIACLWVGVLIGLSVAYIAGTPVKTDSTYADDLRWTLVKDAAREANADERRLMGVIDAKK